MDKETDLTPEKELEAIQATKDEEVRANVIEEFGFDEDDDSEKIDKLVEKDKENRTKLSDAIRQKIKHRDANTVLQTEIDKKKSEEEIPPKKDKSITDEDLDKKLDARDKKKALEDLKYSDELKEEIERVSTISNVSINKALEDPYIASKIADYNKENKVEEASIIRTNQQGNTSNTPTGDDIPEFDMMTDEGRKGWDDWKKEQVKKGN